MENFDLNLNKTNDEEKGIENIEQPKPEAVYKDIVMPFEKGSTLDEPWHKTVVTTYYKGRELHSIWRKIKITFGWGDKKERLNELLKYDLWGPFVFNLIFSAVLSGKKSDQFQSVFVSTFLYAVFGSIIVGVNAKLMSCKMYFTINQIVPADCIYPRIFVASHLYYCCFKSHY